jgi:hypothetical protein
MCYRQLTSFNETCHRHSSEFCKFLAYLYAASNNPEIISHSQTKLPYRRQLDSPHVQDIPFKHEHISKNISVYFKCGAGSSVGIATDYGLDGPGI